ncbi:putative aminoacid transporter [Encephalitozoon intestinalis ATCC 50506]|uniref:Aminoacid transporter n=1 Tax=Encephalitozoon intestinalis (strain ATCC 50506) TaxID=876142 RepID=E0S735_ENCIT|nr:putative aminoacid transporter [Encephalitozoon intestinalis ATCC 50506]ADM11463.2 putative aminoacid transporter [Encephalitozoon intestinalis ATCC 50506]UTX45174.1 amino acid transporter [Encephalitozoon intestinalis]
MSKVLTERSAAMTMVASMLGASIYFTPIAFRFVGYIYGWIIIFIIASLTSFSLYCISYSAIKIGKGQTYSSLGVYISPRLKHVLDGFVIVNSLSANVCLYRYLSELVVAAFPELLLTSFSYETTRKGIVAVLLIPFFALSSHKNLSSLRYVSLAMVVSIGYFIFLLISYNLFLYPKYTSYEETSFPLSNGFSFSIPIFITAMACQSNMVKVLDEMASDSMRKVKLVSVWSGVGGGLIYGLIGHLGYSLFGNTLNGDLLRILADKGSSINIQLASTVDKYLISSRVAVYGCILIFIGSFPIQLNPLITTLFNILPEERRTNTTRMFLMAALIMLCFFLVLVEDLSAGLVISIGGATVTNFISFLFPFIFFISVRKRFSLSTFLALVCIAACVSSSVYMLANIVTGRNKIM